MSTAIAEVATAPMSAEACANSPRGFLSDPTELNLLARSEIEGFALCATPEHREELRERLRSFNSSVARHRDPLSDERKNWLNDQLCTTSVDADKVSMWLLRSDGYGRRMYDFRPLPKAAWYFDADSHILRIVGKFICPNGTECYKMQLRISMRDGSVAAYHAA